MVLTEELVLQGLERTDPLLRVEAQHFLHQVVAGRAHLRQDPLQGDLNVVLERGPHERHVLWPVTLRGRAHDLEYLVQLVALGRATEQRRSLVQFTHDAAARPDVNGRGVGHAQQHLKHTCYNTLRNNLTEFK